MTPPLIDNAEFAAFLLVLTRVSIIVFLAPIFGSNLVPSQVKAAISLVLAFILTPIVHVDPAALPDSALGFLPLLLGEVFVGLTITLIIRLMLEGAQLAGQYMGFQMGFAIANVMDPQTGAQASVLSQFLYILSIILFLAADGHYIVIRALVRSYDLVPMGRPVLSGPIYAEMNRNVMGMFVVAIKIGAPVLGILFCVQVAMGIVAKTVPQLNVLFVGMPMYIIIGLAMMVLSLSLFVVLFGRYLSRVDQSVFNVLQAM